MIEKLLSPNLGLVEFFGDCKIIFPLSESRNIFLEIHYAKHPSQNL